MSISLIARSARQQSRTVARSLHTTAPARSAHGDYHHLPFALPGKKKAVFGAKVLLYLTVGFSIPFVASAWQLQKAGGA